MLSRRTSAFINLRKSMKLVKSNTHKKQKLLVKSTPREELPKIRKKAEGLSELSDLYLRQICENKIVSEEEFNNVKTKYNLSRNDLRYVLKITTKRIKEKDEKIK